jgi:HemY protein
LQPGFAPGAVMAARLLAADGKQSRAAQILENAWKAAPHPALWLTYRDLKTNETPAERARRLTDLSALNPDHRESRILDVERALIVPDASGAREAAAGLDAEPVTARIAGLRARVAYACGQPDEARLWLAQGMNAPQEPAWSDLDPEGRAFAYPAPDWARLVLTFAETGELIHPRQERGERGLNALPELPIAYADAAPFLSADGRAPELYPLDDHSYDEDDLTTSDPAPPPARRGSGGGSGRGPGGGPGRGRLASGPRAAK